jgi:SAM-dependent methyltransferase
MTPSFIKNILHINRTEICNICSSRKFTVLARRSDNLDVLVCQHCGMGVLELFPNDTAIFYGDSYYEKSQCETDSGYSDYELSSEHGVLWASELVKLIKAEGRILDIGCANGFLLNALGNDYEIYGIEANDKAAKLAESIGAKIISNDILEPKLLLNYSGYFDAITAIAVFEHIKDFKGSIEASLQMLKPDGILIFEVPLVSENSSNEMWFKSSLEHLFYPTIKGIRHLFDVQLKTPMIGGELIIRDYASTFVGIATGDDSTFTSIKVLYERLLFTAPTNLSREERRAQLLLKVIHAADPKPEHLSFVDELFPFNQQTPFLSRCLDLWKADSVRLQTTMNYLIEVEAAKEWHSQNAERWQLAYKDAIKKEGE